MLCHHRLHRSFIEQPSDLLARAQVWSNYKHHASLKFLIGITPQGTIFVSQCAGGRISDKEITEQSGIMKNILPGIIIFILSYQQDCINIIFLR